MKLNKQFKTKKGTRLRAFEERGRERRREFRWRRTEIPEYDLARTHIAYVYVCIYIYIYIYRERERYCVYIYIYIYITPHVKTTGIKYTRVIRVRVGVGTVYCLPQVLGPVFRGQEAR